MEDIKIDIPYVTVMNDFTIIYKVNDEIEEIQTSKEEFIHKLRYFKQRVNEINIQNEIFIHEEYPIEIFKEFINTLTTNKITLNEKNYLTLKKLSHKYCYYELQQVLDKYSKERPDIKHIIDEYSNTERDDIKEEEMSRHLDICLQNENMINFPIETLIRIINSPNRNLQDHHLLFKFIKRLIEKYQSQQESENKDENNNNNTKDGKEEENLQILVSSLDYRRMSRDEIKEILKSKYFTSIFELRGNKEMIKTLLESNEQNETRISELEEQNRSSQNNYEKIFKSQSQEIEILEEQLRTQTQKNERIESELQQLREMIETQIKQNQIFEEHIRNNSMNQDKQKEIIETQETRIKTLEDKIQQNSENIEKRNIIIDTQNKTIKEIESKMNISSQAQKKQKEIIETQGKRIYDIEKKIHKLSGTITMNIEQDQKIKGIINIKEDGSKLDQKRSKYILDMNPSGQLGASSYKQGNSIEKLKQEVLFMKRAGTYFLHVLLVDNFEHETELVSKGVTTKGFALTYDFTGRVETVTLDSGKYKLEVWGAEGGETKDFSKTPGKGGYSYGTLTLQSKTKLYIHVGECPKDRIGGWNGGGDGGKSELYKAPGGGGSTDISLFGEEGSDNWNNPNHLYSRIIVAGGGGGSGDSDKQDWYGGFGGGTNGQCGGRGPKGNEGTQTGAGTSHENSKGQGFGVGGTCTKYISSGGGASDRYGGGSGGSGYVYNSSTAKNYPSDCKLNKSFYLINSNTISGDQDIPNPRNSTTEKGHSGHGYARITLQ